MIETLIAALAKNIWSIFIGFIGLIIWFTRLEWLAKNNKDRIDKLEQKLEKEVDQISSNVKDIGTEMRQGFQHINDTLQKMMYKLGEKSDRQN